MKNKVLFSLFCFLFAVSVRAQQFPYNTVFETLDGNTISLSQYQTKKILIVTLPCRINTSTDSFLTSLDTISRSRSASLKIVGVPAFEDGYSDAQKNILNQWYRSRLNNNIIITSGLNTRQSSGAVQHDLFKWLTNVNQNMIFNIDVDGPGFRCFIKPGGEFYGVLRSNVNIHGRPMQRVLEL